jgi:hypothetical protein
LVNWWLLPPIGIEIKLNNVGRFVIFVKTITLSHYHISWDRSLPLLCIKDSKGEFIAVSSAEVVNK